MNMPTDMIWNMLLTGGLGLVGAILRYAFEEIQRLQILLNRTREEIAKEYVTKAEVHADINRVIVRIDNLDAKIERLLERFVK
jgi:hypothetical protein